MENTGQGGICFHPAEHIPVPMPHARAVPNTNAKCSTLCLFGQHLMLSIQWWLRPSQLPTCTLAGAKAAEIEPLSRGSTRCPLLRGLSLATSTHTQFLVIPPKRLSKAAPSCWSSPRAKGAARPAPASPFSPSCPGEKPLMAPKRLKQMHNKEPLTCQIQALSLTSKRLMGSGLFCPAATACYYGLHQKFYPSTVCAQGTPEQRSATAPSTE